MNYETKSNNSGEAVNILVLSLAFTLLVALEVEGSLGIVCAERGRAAGPGNTGPVEALLNIALCEFSSLSGDDTFLDVALQLSIAGSFTTGHASVSLEASVDVLLEELYNEQITQVSGSPVIRRQKREIAAWWRLEY